VTCENVFDSYYCVSSRNLRFCYNCIYGTDDCYDVSTYGESMEHCYELSGCGGALEKSGISNVYFSSYIFYGGYNILYSTNCHEHSKELFGCCDLRRREYCILNRQYSKEEYERLVPRIVDHMRATGEWGEFFPIGFSPFSYNESLAQEFFPLDRERAAKLGSRWSSEDTASGTAAGAVAAEKLPDRAEGFDALGVTVICEVTGRGFRYTPTELEFYRRNDIPLPRRHPEQRERDRRARANPRRLYRGSCAACAKEITTSYGAGREARVLCEGCFNAEIY
jgi:hypothetical protein